VVSDADRDPAVWPNTIAAVGQLVAEGLDLGPATILIGENGTGKSTLVEAIATAYGMNPEGGSTGARNRTFDTESGLHSTIEFVRGAGASRWGYFLRAETLHGLYTYLELNSGDLNEAKYHRHSHGEGFRAILDSSRFSGVGFFVMDEPEAGLSFGAQLALVADLINFVRENGAQVLIATHSPIIAALPGAHILELDHDGYHPATWSELEMVDHYRRFLNNPETYLRYLTTN
ncbi:MAG: AAA family ATPase, partial [Antricoccus sp.]